jgi:hypothetical protein
MPRRPNKRRVARSAQPLSEQIERRLAAVRRNHTLRVARIRLQRHHHSTSPPPIPPSIINASTVAAASLFTRHPITTIPASRALPPLPVVRSRPLPVGRRRLIPGKSYLLDIGTCTIECPSCLALHWKHELSSKGTQRLPSFSTCCADGAIHLPPLLDAPPYLQYLLSRANQGTLSLCHITDI